MSTALFAILDNHITFYINPIIPSLVYVFSIILITGILYYKFQYVKSPKPKKEKDLNVELIEK